ncbi:helix-turn-helix domain-containing protein [Providencia sp. wls1914]|uniref:helix-turn-helix domain-containing protein n=1 Tax=Providencia sp. wls1914 TaxID=2675156 RepID=UPI0012B5D47E|nr:helix-turn-helix transcriptional regulator [Providencia sp. wls1914]MTC72532.1 helix-turn-helix domain-containing protein [Providencia sp. wls1914]HEQ1858974.1 helix-turn-helix transcriptional regulator [Providencia alcalifaciens]
MEINDSLTVRVGRFIRKSRTEMGLTGAQLAELMNISQQQISRYETARSNLNLEQLDDLLCVLDKSWRQLIDAVEADF